ncbi:hypothetical protein ACPOL_4879 [Acidisarcina polymorpha]|uniref:Uncharacterized protein n=1 Tax=Acidisarcina polymorpha TaxID=2211140 RepID=A0A2Z5G4Z3_9BACT|nr:hypothetical protein ACPOL_4879 [Acidisarcina polymorpha]
MTPGPAGAGGGVDGVTGVADCWPNIALADIDAAIIALTNSRRRIGTPLLRNVVNDP